MPLWKKGEQTVKQPIAVSFNEHYIKCNYNPISYWLISSVDNRP